MSGFKFLKLTVTESHAEGEPDALRLKKVLLGADYQRWECVDFIMERDRERTYTMLRDACDADDMEFSWQRIKQPTADFPAGLKNLPPTHV